MNGQELSDKIWEILNSELQGLNLTAIRDSQEFYIKQIVDSVLPFENQDLIKLIDEYSTFVDIGFGGGFPLLPLANLFRQKNFFGLEARNKKVQAVQLIANKLELKNVKTYHRRMEEIFFDVDTVLTFKAVADISELLSLIKSDHKILACFYKGPNTRDLEVLKDEYFSSWFKIFEFDYALPSGDRRSFYIYKNKSVPRGTFATKSLVKLSSII